MEANFPQDHDAFWVLQETDPCLQCSAPLLRFPTQSISYREQGDKP